MTLEIRTVNLLLETSGGGRHQGGATWYLFNSHLDVSNGVWFQHLKAITAAILLFYQVVLLAA